MAQLPDEEHEVWRVGQHEGGLVPPSAISSSSEGLQLGERSDSGSDVGDDQMVMLGCQETAAGSEEADLDVQPGDDQDGLRCRGIDGADLDVQYVSSRGWQLGWHVGSWGTGNFTQQAQVLVTNLYVAVKNLPMTLRSQLRDYFLGRAQKFFQKSMGKRVSPVLRVAGGLLGLSSSRVWRIVAQVRGNFWEPVPPHQQSSTDITPAPTEAARLDRVRLTLVRAALAVRTSSGPTNAFVMHLARLAVEGVDVGEKYHTKEFFSDVLFLSARCVQAYDAQELYEKLQGTGIRSDFALLLDGVPVGGVSLHGRHGNVDRHMHLLCQPAHTPVAHTLVDMVRAA